MAFARPESSSLEPADSHSVNSAYFLLLQLLQGLSSLKEQILLPVPGPLCQPRGRQDSLCPDLLGWAPHSIIPMSITGLIHTQLCHQLSLRGELHAMHPLYPMQSQARASKPTFHKGSRFVSCTGLVSFGSWTGGQGYMA